MNTLNPETLIRRGSWLARKLDELGIHVDGRPVPGGYEVTDMARYDDDEGSRYAVRAETPHGALVELIARVEESR